MARRGASRVLMGTTMAPHQEGGLMRKLLGLMAGLAFAATTVQAQIEAGDKAVSVFGNLTINKDYNSGTLGGGLNTYFTNNLGLRVLTMLNMSSDGSGGTMTFTTVGAGVEVDLAPRGAKSMPYVFADMTVAASSCSGCESTTDFTPGVGFRTFLSRQASFFAQASYKAGRNGASGSTTIDFGLQYFIGKKR